MYILIFFSRRHGASGHTYGPAAQFASAAPWRRRRSASDFRNPRGGGRFGRARADSRTRGSARLPTQLRTVSVSVPTVKRETMCVTGPRGVGRDPAAPAPASRVRVVPGGTTEAREWYAKLDWETSRSARCNFGRRRATPLRCGGRVPTHRGKPPTCSTTRVTSRPRAGYSAEEPETAVCALQRGSIMAVFVTATAIPSLDAVARQARVASRGAPHSATSRRPAAPFAWSARTTRATRARCNACPTCRPAWRGPSGTTGCRRTHVERLGRHVLHAVLRVRRPASDMPRFVLPVHEHVRRRARASCRRSPPPHAQSCAPPDFRAFPRSVRQRCPRRRWASPNTLRSTPTPTAHLLRDREQHHGNRQAFATDAVARHVPRGRRGDIGTQPCMLVRRATKMHGPSTGARTAADSSGWRARRCA